MWKVGQQIIAIANSYKYKGIRAVIKDKSYVIKAIFNCQCGTVDFDIGAPNVQGINGSYCTKCSIHTNDGIWWQNSNLFRPAVGKSAIKDLCGLKIVTETSDSPMKNPSPMKPLRELINN